MSGNEKRGKAVRGFVRGLLWGSLAAAGGLVVVSQVSGPPVSDAQQDRDATTRAEVSTPSADGGEQGAAPPSEPVAEPAPAPLAVTQAPDAPESAGASNTLPALPTTTEAPPAQAVADLPATPEADGPIALVPAPAEPPVAPPSDAPADQMAAAGQIAPPSAPVPGELPLASTPPDSLGLPEAEQAPAPADLPPPLSPQDETLLLPLPDAAPVDPVPEPSEPDPTPEPMPLPEPEPAAPPTGTLAPAPELANQTPGVVTGRLPRIGAEPAPEVTQGAPEFEDDESLPPLRRFARPFENAGQKPLFAILLQDNGKDGVNRAELAALALPLSIVIDPLSDGAADRAAIWRAGGQEVVMAGTGIPAGAGPGDLEQSFQVLASRLPEAVAVIDPDGSAFQNNRPLATQVVPILAAQGRGLVTFDQGLNAADQVARREGLAAATIFRSIDDGAEDSPVIRRYLDRAAFKAAQEGRVVVIGVLRPETVAGILEWAVEGRASTVALAPISAMLQN
ncbi:polysaccharide deacteylase family 2 protein [Pseudotabrizicola sp.]|uniref:polysaccharide deacteylase family 2 protein n=1 Tax=Pseudotabrizicola sp. TaxID=2939647 RepID=UPI00272D145F|nr:polysaccharide deacteylase family 2 protein [Pseudotabrizicola sp.]